jgi:hypothetical protein
MKQRKNSLAVPPIDTVRARKPTVAVSIQGTHIVYHGPLDGSRSAPPRCAVAKRTAGLRNGQGMTKAKPSRKQGKEPAAKTHQLDSSNPQLKYIGGSKFDAWNNTIANQTIQTLWSKNWNEDERKSRISAALVAPLVSARPSGAPRGSDKWRHKH